MSGLIDHLLHLPSWLVLVTVAAVVFAEDALFVGFVVPGESAAVIAGVAAGLGHVPLWLAIVVVVASAIVGDFVGYEVGRRIFGPRLLDSRFLDRHRDRIDGARDLLRRRGGFAVFLGRFTAFFRAMMPALAGASGMPPRRFLVWNALGGLLWGTGTVVVGYLAGTSYHLVEHKLGIYSAVALAVVVVLVVVVWAVRRHRRPSEKTQ